MRPGRCYVCHVEGTEGRRRDFLCDTCSHPEEVRVYCARCKVIATANEDEILALAAMLPNSCEPKPGTSIRLPFCAKCCTPQEFGTTPTVGVYALAPD